MGPALAPVEACARERPACGARSRDVDAELGEPALAAGGQDERAVADEEQLARDQRLGEADSELACEVVVAGPRLAQGSASPRRSE